MENNFELGIMNDTMMYFEIYYNYPEFIQQIEDHNYDIKEGLKYYNRVKKDIEPSPQLQAFFDLNKNTTSLLVYIFVTEIRKIKTINDFIAIIKNKDMILYSLIDYYFEESTLQEKDEIKKNYADNTIIEKIFSLDINSNTKGSLVLIFTNYNEIINLLIDSICKMFTNIRYLHEANKKLIIEFSIKENYMNILKDIYKLKTFENIIYCISLLDIYSIKTMHEIYFVLGSHYQKKLDNQYKFINVTFSSICKTFAIKLNNLIVDILYKHKKLCVSEIEDLLPDNYSDSTIYRAITNLHSEKVIERIEITNGKHYFALNTNYFEYATIVSKNNLLYYVDKKIN